ncbi:IS3 family transposase [Lactobacillus helveticus]|uniref:Transposase n=1 Tax=Lactobacillus helveticus TaxID=1587 RepID=A0A2X0PAF4_LACHE|nr:IS3 family transposase [Lactobacillus helveticus]EGF35080.1 Transposase [Lactobacillus helveticus MTCC 5463]MBW7979838.1 IS3 family transposase [Lactobacillus helveticus]MCT3406077.1 IS3 family transposase [Lactobacillus helveticus]MCT3419538.1 IS3 family transposase [Lactobacillus helveticus]MCT3421504.1 IS3 family transposase [Lactobacillus helveticus]
MPTRYDKEFKQNIINLYKQANQPPNWPENMALAIQPFISGSRAKPKLNLSGKSPDEIKAMEKRLASLSEENEILKKALGFLAQK